MAKRDGGFMKILRSFFSSQQKTAGVEPQQQSIVSLAKQLTSSRLTFLQKVTGVAKKQIEVRQSDNQVNIETFKETTSIKKRVAYLSKPESLNDPKQALKELKLMNQEQGILETCKTQLMRKKGAQDTVEVINQSKINADSAKAKLIDNIEVKMKGLLERAKSICDKDAVDALKLMSEYQHLNDVISVLNKDTTLNKDQERRLSSSGDIGKLASQFEKEVQEQIKKSPEKWSSQLDQIKSDLSTISDSKELLKYIDDNVDGIRAFQKLFPEKLTANINDINNKLLDIRNVTHKSLNKSITRVAEVKNQFNFSIGAERQKKQEAISEAKNMLNQLTSKKAEFDFFDY